MGLLSLVDALIHLPLDEALRRTNVATSISAALLETAPTGPLGTIHRLTSSWEAGDWAAVSRFARQLGVPVAVVGEAYAESTLWAEKALQGIAHRAHSRRHTRQAATGQLRLKWVEAAREKVLNVALVDFSTDGLGLHATEPVPLHSQVWFDAPALGISGRGSVCYCHSSNEGDSIGIERRDQNTALV